jgi:hypothetical protein
MDTVGAHLKGKTELVAYDESSRVLRAQRLQMRKTSNHSVHIPGDDVDAQHEPRDAAHGEGGIQLLDQPDRLASGRADQQELTARLGRGDRLVQAHASSR